MLEEIEEPEIGDGLPKGKLQEPYYDGEWVKMVEDPQDGCPSCPYIEFGARAYTKKKVLPTKLRATIFGVVAPTGLDGL